MFLPLSSLLLISQPRLLLTDRLILNKKQIKKATNASVNMGLFQEYKSAKNKAAERKFNSLGFKDSEWKLEKPNNTYRIIALGDSMTKGAFVGNNATWPSQLEEKLNNLGLNKKFEVLNMGGPAFDTNTYEEYRRLKNTSLSYNPDMVILQYYSNDLRSPKVRKEAKRKWEKYPKGEYELPEKAQKLVREEGASKSSISRIIYELELKKYKKSHDPKEEWDKWVKPYLNKIIKTCRQNEIEFTLITWDLKGWKKKKLKGILNDYNLYLNDFSDYLPTKRPSKYRLPDGHLTPYGYNIVANETLKYIKTDILKRKGGFK